MKLFQRDYEPSLNHAVCDSKALEVPLNLALFVSDKMEKELKTLANLLSQARPRCASAMCSTWAEAR